MKLRNIFFQIFLTLYASSALLLLLLGLLPFLIPYIPALETLFHNLADSNEAGKLIAHVLLDATAHAENPGQVALDYFLSTLNFAVGLFLVLRRNTGTSAKLFGMGMIGTSMAFNFQAHGFLSSSAQTAFNEFIPLLGVYNLIHFSLHAISGAAYLHAILIFPDDEHISPRFRWVPYVFYGLAAYEIVSVIRAILTSGSGVGPITRFLSRTFSLGAVDFYYGEMTVHFEGVIGSEALLMALFFGVLLPSMGVVVQVYRYFRLTTPEKRQQTKIVVWSMALAFGMSLLIVVGRIAYNLVFELPFTAELFEQLETFMFLIFPPLFALIPIAILSSILRYRLWDIDFIINRSLVYGSLAGVLLLLSAVSVFLVTRIFQGSQGSLIAAVAAASMIFGLTFRPVHRRLQRFVDRRFYHIYVDYQETAELKTEIDYQAEDIFREFGPMQRIGKGGMAEVFKALHPAYNQPVAVKILSEELLDQPGFRGRFAREAMLVAGLNHPHIVQVHDYGEQGKIPYIVMEFLEGQNLHKYLNEHGILSMNGAMPIIKQVAEALDYAHGKGLVHRDIKPSNIMITERGAVLMDFGIAKMLDSDTRITRTGILGTFDYIAPEQIQAASDVDHRADVYSFGVMIFQMLTGRLPFQHNNAGALLMAHMRQPAPDPRQYNPNLTPSVANAILRAMAKERSERFNSVGEILKSFSSPPMIPTKFVSLQDQEPDEEEEPPEPENPPPSKQKVII